MPNGFVGSKEEWERLIAPLRHIDEPVAAFARRHGLAVTRNDHGHPERSLRWEEDGLEKLVQIYLDDGARGLYTVWACASTPGGGPRRWKRRFLRRRVPWDEIRDHIDELLAEGYRDASAWGAGDLEPV